MMPRARGKDLTLDLIQHMIVEQVRMSEIEALAERARAGLESRGEPDVAAAHRAVCLILDACRDA